MTISKKNSRNIVVNNEIYTWAISPDSGCIVFIAEKTGIKGRKIEVYIMWVKSPENNDLLQSIITPKIAESIISQAINSGWNPKEKGIPIVFDLTEDLLSKRDKE